MTSMYPSLNASRRKQLASALTQVLAPAQLTAAREFMLAEAPGRLSPQPEEILYWMRVNMPQATVLVERIIFPHE